MIDTIKIEDFRSRLREEADRSYIKYDLFSYEECEKIFDYMNNEFIEIMNIKDYEFYPQDIYLLWKSYDGIADFDSDNFTHDYNECQICDNEDNALEPEDFIKEHLILNNVANDVIKCEGFDKTTYLVIEYSAYSIEVV